MFTRFRSLIFATKVLNNDLCIKINAECPIYCTDLLRIEKRHKTFGNRKSWPNNWLPFKWERPEKIPGYFATGDPPTTEGLPKFDPGKLQPFFDNSEELKNAPEEVKKLFSLEMLPRGELLKVLIEDEKQHFRRHPFDVYSPEVRDTFQSPEVFPDFAIQINYSNYYIPCFAVAVYTMRIRAKQEILRNHPNSAALKRDITSVAGKRKKWLNVLYRTDKKRYEFVVKALNINNTPSPIGVAEGQRVERKRELRRLTREYCEKLRNEKLNNYHEKLKAEQVRFAKEKEEAEQWIAETLKKFNLKDPRCGEIV